MTATQDELGVCCSSRLKRASVAACNIELRFLSTGVDMWPANNRTTARRRTPTRSQSCTSVPPSRSSSASASVQVFIAGTRIAGTRTSGCTKACIQIPLSLFFVDDSTGRAGGVVGNQGMEGGEQVSTSGWHRCPAFYVRE
eukprot:360912-Chlamydomonas_euryale.AAC.1